MFNKDFGKQSNDLLTKDFPSTHEFSVSSNTDDIDVTYDSYKNKDGSWTSDLTTTFGYKKVDVEAVVSTSGKKSTKFTFKNLIGTGANTSVNFESVNQSCVFQSNSKATVTQDYIFSKGTVQLKLDFATLCSKPVVTLSKVYEHNDKLAFGVEGTVDTNAPKFDAVKLNTQYKHNDSVFNVGLNKKNVNFGYFYAHSKYLFASKVNYQLESSAALISAGIQKNLNGAVGKAVFDTDGNVSFSFKKSCCKNSSVVASSQVNLETFASNFALSFDVDV